MLHRFRTTAAGRPSGGAYEDLAVARYTQASCRLCRREGLKLFLKGERCYTDKCAIERRNYPPGEHGQGRPKFSEYSIQLREKQKLRRIYGVLESQFRRYFAMADRARGVTGETLLQILERRLDNIVYRLGFATSRAEARQLVVHGHFRVNGHKVDIPSYQVDAHDIIDVREKSLEMTPFIVARETHGDRIVPAWLEAIPTRMRVLVHSRPVRAQIEMPVQ